MTRERLYSDPLITECYFESSAVKDSPKHLQDVLKTDAWLVQNVRRRRLHFGGTKDLKSGNRKKGKTI